MTTYKSKLTVRVRWTVTPGEGEEGAAATYEEARECGLLPIMVKVSKMINSLRTSMSSSAKSTDQE